MPNTTIENVKLAEIKVEEDKNKAIQENKEELVKANMIASQIIIDAEKESDEILKKTRDETSKIVEQKTSEAILKAKEHSKEVCTKASVNENKAIEIIISGIKA